MSDWLTELVESGNKTAIERTVRWDGEERTVYFKRISAAERVQLVAGQKVVTTAKRGGSDAEGSETEIEVDLGAQEGTKQKLVYFSCCKHDGSRQFAKASDVGKLAGGLVNALFKIASEINRDDSEEDLGKG